jgi:hypothetical protein
MRFPGGLVDLTRYSRLWVLIIVHAILTGLSRLLREGLAKGNLTFYHVGPIYFNPPLVFKDIAVALGLAPHKYVSLLSDLPGRYSQVDQFALIFFPALISGRLFDLGYLRSTLILASINLIVCTISIAECNEFWQILLCQGFGIGVSVQKRPLSKDLTSNRPLSLAFMWSHIWTCDECHRSLVQKETLYGTWDQCFCFLDWRHGVPCSIPQLARRSRVRTAREFRAHQLRFPTASSGRRESLRQS